MAVSRLFAVYGLKRDRMWRKVMSITQYLPNKNLDFPEYFYVLRMQLNIQTV